MIESALVPTVLANVDSMWFNSEQIDFYFRNHAALITEGYVRPMDSNALLNRRTRVKPFMGFEKQDLNSCNFLFYMPQVVENKKWVVFVAYLVQHYILVMDLTEYLIN